VKDHKADSLPYALALLSSNGLVCRDLPKTSTQALLMKKSSAFIKLFAFYVKWYLHYGDICSMLALFRNIKIFFGL
jgi:hypothetical protein